MEKESMMHGTAETNNPETHVTAENLMSTENHTEVKEVIILKFSVIIITEIGLLIEITNNIQQQEKRLNTLNIMNARKGTHIIRLLVLLIV